MAADDFKNNPTKRSLLALPQILKPGGTQQIRDIDTNYWFGPLQPVRPVAPASYRPRQYAYTPGGNIVWTPGEDDGGISFGVLRNLADSWDLLRIVIETQKDRLCDTKFEVRAKAKPQETNKDRRMRNASDPVVKQLNDFLAYPDGFHDFAAWLRMLLEDMLVIDAVALYLERDKSGKIASLHPIAGDTINRLMTDQGITPPPPSAAYQQIVYGSPACNFTTDDLVYYMRNERTNKRYGFSPVEQILITISIALRRQEFQLQYYTSGNVPEALCFLPNNLPIDDVKEIQDWFDAAFAGDLAKRRRLTFLPGMGTGDQARPNVMFTKEPLLKDEMDEWLARIACFCIGVSPQPFLKMMNRASAEQAQTTSEEEGKAPYAASICAILNNIIQQKMGFGGYEVVQQQHQEMDVLKSAEADGLLVGKVYTVNETRERRGDDPREEPEANMLGVFTATGFVPIDAEPADPIEGDGGGEPDDTDPNKKKGKPNGKQQPTSARASSKKLVHSSGAGTNPPVVNHVAGFDPAHSVTAAPAPVGQLIVYGVPVEKRKHKASHQHGTLTAKGDKAAKRVQKFFTKLLSKMEDEVLSIVGPHLAKVAKAVTEEEAAKLVQRVLDAMDDFWLLVPEAVGPDFESAYISQALESARLLDVDVTTDLLALINDSAAAWASKRSAELVGMRYTRTGKLVANPNADMTISEPTRSKLRDIITAAFKDPEFNRAQFVQAIQDAGTFSDTRAEKIARTEVARTQTLANMETWKQTGVVESSEWMTSEDEGVCPECDENDGAVAALGEEFPSGAESPADTHPECRCILTPAEVVNPEEEEEAA